jgi:hypothetical protein
VRLKVQNITLKLKILQFKRPEKLCESKFWTENGHILNTCLFSLISNRTESSKSTDFQFWLLSIPFIYSTILRMVRLVLWVTYLEWSCKYVLAPLLRMSPFSLCSCLLWSDLEDLICHFNRSRNKPGFPKYWWNSVQIDTNCQLQQWIESMSFLFPLYIPLLLRFLFEAASCHNWIRKYAFFIVYRIVFLFVCFFFSFPLSCFQFCVF